MNLIRTRKRRATVLGASTAASVLALSGVAVADDIYNNLDTSIDAVAETMPLNVEGGNGTTTLYVNTTNGDGKSGCNFGGTTGDLQISIASSNASVATVSPSTATFDSCGDTAVLTVTPVGAGTATISAAQLSNTTGSTFNLAPAEFTVNVTAPAPANTAPAVTVAGVTAGESYQKGSVPPATCEVTDAEDNPRGFAATLSGTLDSDGLGSQTASCSYTDRGTPGLTASDSKTYSIVDKTRPVIGYTISPANPNGLASWYTDTVTVDWTVTEDDSPRSLTHNCDDVTISTDQLGTTYTCSAKSSGGEHSITTDAIKRDGTAPVITDDSANNAPTGTEGSNGWFRSDVTVTFRASDNLSGFNDKTNPYTFTRTASGDGEGITVGSGTVEDIAGNTSNAVTKSFNIDSVAPSVGDAVLSGTRNAAGWYKEPVTASFTGTDATSGVAGNNPKTVSTGTGQGELTLSSPEFSDVAGNTTAAGAKSATVKVDTVAPDVPTFVGGPSGSHVFGAIPAEPTCESHDATSQLKDCVVTGYSALVGSHTMTATATDQAGNTRTATRSYTVDPWRLSGFYSPVDMGGVLNTVKGGSTVPLKFEMFAGATELTSLSDITSFKTATVNCVVLGTSLTDEIEVTTTGGTSLRYDTTGGQFIQNWKTPTGAGTCYRATMTARDGSTLVAYFKTR